MKSIVFILARKNSIRLKNKNHLKISNFSLVERAVKFAFKLNYVDKIILSTDDNFNFKENYKLKLHIVKRPKKLAGSKARSEDSILHAVKKLKLEDDFKDFLVILLQPTSPFRSKILIKKAYNKIKKKNFSNYSIISVSKSQFKNKNTLSINKNGRLIKKKLFKQKLINCVPNGNFYIARFNYLKKNRFFFKENKSIPILIDDKKLKIDIDTKKDFLLAKRLELR